MKKIIALILILITAFTWVNETSVQAQDKPSEWSAPQNISKSGSASNPMLIADPNGRPFVLWEDAISGFFFSFLTNDTWSEPEPIQMPFLGSGSPTIYQYLSGGNNLTYLFWVNNQQKLYYSQLRFGSLDESLSWEKVLTVGVGVYNFRAHIDEDGNIHLIYLVTEDTSELSAGIYYRRITAAGAIQPPVEMDLSPYYRKTGQAGLENQVGNQASFTAWSTGAGSENTLFLAWSNPSTRRLYLRRSTNAGDEWGKIEEIVIPDESTANQFPQMPYFAKAGNSILLLWQDKQAEDLCKQYYQVSDDLGETWGIRKELLPDIFGCPEVNQVYPAGDHKSLLASILNNQLYLTLLEDLEPGQPQIQGELSSFSDPVTFNFVQLKSQQLMLVGERLYFWGTGEGDFPDIWISYRPFDTLFEQGDQKETWTNAKVIVQQRNLFRDIFLLGTAPNITHAFWAETERKNDPGTAIFYASWTALENIRPESILSSVEGKTDQPSAAVAVDGRVYVVWSGGKSGELNISYSDIAQASTEIDWSAPEVIFSGPSAAADPVLKIGQDGTLYVAYLVPLNEERGVYVINSLDRGESWSAPTRVFDAAAQKCDMVEHLSFTITNQDAQHLSWMCSTVPGGTGTFAFKYANSFDFGQTWAETHESEEMRVLWGEVAGQNREDLHLIWLEETEGGFQLWDQVSVDDGRTWPAAKVIETFEDEIGPSSIAIDPGGQLFLTVIAQDAAKILLHSLIWNGETWTSLDDFTLATGWINLVDSLSTIVLPQGELVVVYSLENPTASSDLLYNSLLTLSHPVTVKPALSLLTPSSTHPTAEAASTPVPGISTSEPSNLTPITQPTVDLQALKEEAAPRMNNLWIYAIGAILAVVVVVFTFLLRQHKH